MADKRIQGKPVRIDTVAKVQDIGTPQLLFVASPTVAARQAAIAYAQSRGILTVSDSGGLCRAGRCYPDQLCCTECPDQNQPRSCRETGLHIGAPLLSIATVLRGEAP